jgi:hypothetical protein
MQVVSCNAPTGHLDPAPLTCLPLPAVGEGRVSAFWHGDDEYYVRVDGTTERAAMAGADVADAAVAVAAAADADGVSVRWFQIVWTALPCPNDDAARAGAARQWLDIIPMGGGRVAFPVGSTGRTVYRVWRSRGARPSVERAGGRTRILGVRAGRSLRRPA